MSNAHLYNYGTIVYYSKLNLFYTLSVISRQYKLTLKILI